VDEKTSPFDTYIQNIDSSADLRIDDKQLHLKLSGSIIISTNTKHSFTTNEQIKMLNTIIKRGYEE
jgi:hypothetical protein